jgi:hypothetical protein
MRRQISIVLIAISVVGILVILFQSKFSSRSRVSSGNCPVEEKIIQSNDPLLTGVVAPGEKLKVLLGWYNCHAVEEGDLVLFSYDRNAEPIVRIVRGVEGDRFRVVPDLQRRAWNLIVNGKAVMYQDKPYFFGAETPPTLSLFEKNHPKGLLPGEVILLSSLPPGNLDSGFLGILGTRDILGKVEHSQ